MPKKKPTSTPVEALTHKAASRKNIPTEELRDFLVEESPKAMLYPRDPSLDPQLVWKGKDEQDAAPLEVPVVPIYIQEKIHPQALIDDFRSRHAAKPHEQQLDLFADFNGIDSFDKKIEFYQHDAHWTNRMILGDSLAIMTSLAEKEGLKGQVQTIYLDPPYGIKFGSNWQVSTRKRDVKDGSATDATRQPEQVKAFRDTWELGIHSYLTYLRDRLTVARDLLTDSGSVFVQIGDENVHRVRALMDEVFGEGNFVAEIIIEKTAGAGMEYLDLVADFVLLYAKQREHLKYRQLTSDKMDEPSARRYYRYLETPDGQRRAATEDEIDFPPEGCRIFSLDPLTSQTNAATTRYDAEFHGSIYESGPRQWATPRQGMARLMRAERVDFRGTGIGYVRYLADYPVKQISNVWSDISGSIQSRTDPKVYVVQTSTSVIERCLLMTTDPGDLVLDPTCGSGTTAYVAEQWGRRWITCDTSRVALALARTRLMAAKFPFYLLADSPAGVAKEAGLTGQKPPAYDTHDDVRKGFVYKRVPHVTLKSIANNEEIDVIHTRWQPQVDAARAAVNKGLGTKYEEWEVPRSLGTDEASPRRKSGGDSQTLLDAYWDVRRKRQREIDDCIAKHADPQLLFGQPYEDNGRLRVTGPFTVESLSPHRRLTVAEKKDRAAGKDGLAVRTVGPDQFGGMIIDNLRKAGIQARDKAQRLKFDSLDPFAGEWIHAVGSYTDAEGTEKRVAVCIGPEHGTVGPDLVKEAAKEAIKGVGFDLLYILGFAFDPHVDEETKRYGKLGVHICRMNPDLSMGDELLKKTGAGNLFMVFGEPDITIRTTGGTVIYGTNAKPRRAGGRKSPESVGDDELVVEIRGVDVYDPTTGEIRSESTDDIACWFIDTSYDGESFFVRHAYFTGNQQPYEKLKRALKAEIDEAAWSTLYQTTSQPFPKPASGKIAVKVINHYGDEVLKVYGVG